jgi:hypothetical protein
MEICEECIRKNGDGDASSRQKAAPHLIKSRLVSSTRYSLQLLAKTAVAASALADASPSARTSSCALPPGRSTWFLVTRSSTTPATSMDRAAAKSMEVSRETLAASEEGEVRAAAN